MVSDLTTTDEVKLVAGLNNSEVSDSDIDDHIIRVTSYIIEKYGNPVEKTNILLESDEYIYDFSGDKRPSYRVDYVEADGSSLEDVGSYTVNLNNSTITLASTVISDYAGERLEVEWIPKKANLLATYKTALEVLENLYVVTGDEVTNAKMNRVGMMVNDLGSLFQEDISIMMSTQGVRDSRSGKYILQDFNNTY